MRAESQYLLRIIALIKKQRQEIGECHTDSDFLPASNKTTVPPTLATTEEPASIPTAATSASARTTGRATTARGTPTSASTLRGLIWDARTGRLVKICPEPTGVTARPTFTGSTAPRTRTTAAAGPTKNCADMEPASILETASAAFANRQVTNERFALNKLLKISDPTRAGRRTAQTRPAPRT
jgi:hypothetical protein